MSDTDVYRVMFKHNTHPEEWRQLYTRNNGYGFYARLSSAQNAIKQVASYTSETMIQKLGPRTYSRFVDGVEVIYLVELTWVDVDA